MADNRYHLNQLQNASNQVSDDELGIGTATGLLLVDEVAGTQLERNFFSCVRLFYEKTVAMTLPFEDQTLADLDARCRMEVTAASIAHLCNCFNKRTHRD